jgi:DNA sulfur modification protein DndB
MKHNVIVKGSIISGDNLHAEYKSRKKPYIESSMAIDASMPQGWVVHHEFKTVKRVHKEKTVGQQLEDKVWQLLYEIGCREISSSGLTLVIREKANLSKNKQIDILAFDDDIAFVVECKSRQSLGKKSLKKDIAEIAGSRNAVENSIRRMRESRSLKFIHVICTENIIWDENDRVDANETGLLIWDEYDLLALSELSSLAGEGAKYQIYNRIFFGKKIKGFELRVPALEAQMAGHDYYIMALSPEDLLKIAYVHHRTGQSSFLELSDSYQRMINKSRIRKIREFIEDGGFFPGSIIVNFHRPFLKKEIVGDKKHLDQLQQNARPVALWLPPYYGCAWIVDGQHRLYGFADTAKKYSDTIPVVAFAQEPNSIEAKMFVDVNKNQKSIEANLLWDLYEDLYANSKDERECQLYAISRIAKLLNSNESSPFHGHIAIPKENNTGNITLTTVCSNIYRQKLLSPGEELLYGKSFEESIQYAFERISLFFSVIRDELDEEWKSGDKHYIRTNAGFVVLIGILRDLIECNISKSELEDTSNFRDACKKFLKPLITHLRRCDKEEIRQYRGAGGAGQKSRQVREKLTEVICKSNIGFRSIWLEKFKASLRDEEDEAKRRQGISYFIDKDENDVLEFKGSFGLDIDRYCRGDGKIDISPKLAEEGVLKSIVGFLNSKGGDLIIGILELKRYDDILEQKLSDCQVADGKIIYGIDPEYSRDEWDGYYQRLISDIENKISGDVLDSELVEIDKLEYMGKDICHISVRPADSKQFLNNQFYVRRGNRTVQLEGPAIDRYWSSKKS